MHHFLLIVLVVLTATGFVVGDVEQCLYPRESETRDVKSLDGVWNFVRGDPFNASAGLAECWYAGDLAAVQATPVIDMPVPASYNDITTDAALRDHVGTVWYDRRFFVADAWRADGRRVWIRFGSVHYAAIVWINGVQVAQHEIGHLPFQADVTEALTFGGENRVTVLCDNRLLPTTIPQGVVSQTVTDNGPGIVQTYTFDFFNYAGIHRSVQLYTTPAVHIAAIQVRTALEDTVGRIDFDITAKGTAPDDSSPLSVRVVVKDKQGLAVASGTVVAAGTSTLSGAVRVMDAKLWWPYLMHSEPGYLYTLELTLVAGDGVTVLDVYRQAVGIRTLKWTDRQFLINGVPAYLRGFGRHEDSDIRGKGLDLALLTKDFDLLRWLGANAYRTSHYPYSEESMQFADEAGIMVIDECPSVNARGFSDALLQNHQRSLAELIVRDRNHPSVVMWSIANEPGSSMLAANAYFGAVANFTRQLDPMRPVTAAIAQPFDTDQAAQHLDIVGFNRYNGWYDNVGRLDNITGNVVQEAQDWHDRHGRPVMMLEYGADTMEGLHLLPSFVWSENYQSELFAQHFRAFDQLRARGFFVGEFIWNFADFKTGQATTRVGGNKKGIFTRQRQPKAAAGLVRQRYQSIGHEEAGVCELPNDLFSYVFENKA